MQRSAFSLLAGLIICTLCAEPSIAADDQAKLEAVRKAITELRQQLESTKGSRDELRQSLENSEKDIGELAKKAEKLQQDLRERQQKLNQLREERGQLQRNKSGQQQQVAEHINTAYRMGQQSSLRMLLNQQDPTNVARNLKYYDYLMRARAERISEYTTTIGRINSIEPEISFQTEQLENNHKQLTERQKQLRSSQLQRRETLSKLLTRIANQDGQLKNLDKDRQQLEQLLNQVSQLLGDISLPENSASFASLKGKLPWPTDGRVLRNYGTPRVSDKMRWQGLLIGGNEGSPVRAVHHGRIVFSDYLRGQGLLLIIDHGAGYLTLYAHNQALYKELGEWVEAGELVAALGNSGGQQTAALYFELRHNGEPTNPKRWFKRPA